MVGGPAISLIVPIVIAMTLDEVLLGVKNQSNLDISCSHLFTAWALVPRCRIFIELHD